MIFDRYIIIDWSASNRPKAGADSIWICNLGQDRQPTTTNPRTRGAAETAVRGLLVDSSGRRERVLIGFDFPYAYPSGLAATLSLDGPPWRGVWKYLDEQMRDDPQTNRSNRFEVASAINARLSAHAFWGRPPKKLLDHLSARRDQVRYRVEGEIAGLSEWREVEQVLRKSGHHPRSTWKLFGAGSVGSQALTSIPVASRLRRDDELAGISWVWPFEVVPDLPAGRPAIIHVEIWPSLIDIPKVEGQVKDESQVIPLANEFRDRDRAGTLGNLFAAAAMSEVAEEGWILGVQASPSG